MTVFFIEKCTITIVTTPELHLFYYLNFYKFQWHLNSIFLTPRPSFFIFSSRTFNVCLNPVKKPRSKLFWFSNVSDTKKLPRTLKVATAEWYHTRTSDYLAIKVSVTSCRQCFNCKRDAIDCWQRIRHGTFWNCTSRWVMQHGVIPSWGKLLSTSLIERGCRVRTCQVGTWWDVRIICTASQRSAASGVNSGTGQI